MYFDAAGVPQPPPTSCPPRFPWGQVLVDWQSQCAMNVTHEDGVYARPRAPFLPTAGCEADSSTVETAYERTVPPDVIDPAPADAGLALEIVPPARPRRRRSVVVEHCLGFDDPAGTSEDSNRRARVRVQQTLRPSDDADGAFVLDAIVAWKEYYYEPFNNATRCARRAGGRTNGASTRRRIGTNSRAKSGPVTGATTPGMDSTGRTCACCQRGCGLRRARGRTAGSRSRSGG